MAGTVQKNFRMSAKAVKLLGDIARSRGITETDVIEICVAKYAAETGGDIDGAKALLLEKLAAGIAARKTGKQP